MKGCNLTVSCKRCPLSEPNGCIRQIYGNARILTFSVEL